MDSKFLIDTNIIIYYLNDSISVESINLIENIFIESFNISTITKIELLGWKKIDTITQLKIKEFISNAKIYYLDFLIEEKAIEIKQTTKISLPDAVIAATAIINNFTLITRNIKDFEQISTLKILNPFDSILK